MSQPPTVVLALLKPVLTAFFPWFQPVRVPAHGLLESNDGQILRAAALNGHGVLVQPTYIVHDDVMAGRLVPVLDDWDLPRLRINFAYPTRKHLTPKVRALIDFLVDAFRMRAWPG